MAIGPIENATIARLQDFSVMKQNEDSKSMTTQGHIYQNVQKNAEEKPHVVQKQEGTSAKFNGTDENTKGNSYYGDGGRQRNNKNESTEKVVVKKKTGGFDIKI